MPEDLRAALSRDLCKPGVIRAHPAVAARLLILIPVLDLDPPIAFMKHRIQLEVDVPPARFSDLGWTAYVDLQPLISRIVDPPRRPGTIRRQQHHNGYGQAAAVMRGTP